MRKLFLIFLLCLMITACSKDPNYCKSSTDCLEKDAQAFQVSCINNQCVYTPKPNVVGNGICDSGENECTAPMDCGQCTGKVPGSIYLEKKCINKECVTDIIATKIQTEYFSKESTSLGNKFMTDVLMNNPFNVKKDIMDLKIKLLSGTGTNYRIKSINIQGTTTDRRTINLASKATNKPIWPNQQMSEQIILDIPLEDETISNIEIEITYSYLINNIEKESKILIRESGKYTLVKPEATYPCPESCNDGNIGTRDYCGIETNYFCKHEPIPNVCGNGLCDGMETKCTCPQDCGPCTGSAGANTDYYCKQTECVGKLKSMVNIKQNNMFDERKIGPIELTSTIEYNTPFNALEDKLIVNIEADLNNAKELEIEDIRLLEGNQQIAHLQTNRKITKDSQFEISIPETGIIESEKRINLGIWYTYKTDTKDFSGHFTKSLGKVSIIEIQ